MTTVYEIPLDPEPQQFQISLAQGLFTFVVRWNEPAACWILDVTNSNGDSVLQGIPLVTGVDLLGQYQHLNPGGKLVVQSDVDINRVPDFKSLGRSGHLYFVLP